MPRSFEDLVAEAESVSVVGWDFSWLDGRATEQRPSWGYQRLMGARMAQSAVALDIETGGGEVLAGVPWLAARTAVTAEPRAGGQAAAPAGRGGRGGRG